MNGRPIPGFVCWKEQNPDSPCGRIYEAEVQEVEGKLVPQEYSRACEECGAVLTIVPDVRPYKGLIAADGKQTGPKTQQGKKRSAKNGEKVDPDKRKGNQHAAKHGGYLKQSLVLQAQPGRWDICQACPVFEACDEGYFAVCMRQAASVAEHQQVLLESGKDPEQFRGTAARFGAQMMDVLTQLTAAVSVRGVVIDTVATDKKGEPIYLVKTDPKTGATLYETDEAGRVRLDGNDDPIPQRVPLFNPVANPAVQNAIQLFDKLKLSPDQTLSTPKTAKESENQGTLADALAGLFGVAGDRGAVLDGDEQLPERGSDLLPGSTFENDEVTE